MKIFFLLPKAVITFLLIIGSFINLKGTNSDSLNSGQDSINYKAFVKFDDVYPNPGDTVILKINHFLLDFLK